MKLLLVLEEVAIFAGCLVAFALGSWQWWFFPAFLLLPDISMLGYAFGPKLGAVLYNIFHHRALALAAVTAGMLLPSSWLILAGIVLLAHISMDRALGYGLKQFRGFRYTHLGDIQG